MPDVCRTPDLIVDDRDLVPLGAEPQHRPHEVVSRRPEQPGRTDDPRLLARCGLAVGLRAPVGRERVRRVGLDVRRALLPVEDVIARVEDDRAQLGGLLRPADVDRGRALGIVLGAIDVSPGGSVQNEVGRPDPCRRRDADVPVGVGQRDEIVTGERLDERLPELAARAGD